MNAALLVQLRADRDRQFADWGVPVVLREITPGYEPQSQQVVEPFVETELVAVIGSGRSRPAAGTGGHALTDELTFLVRPEDLPTAVPAPTARIVSAGAEYDILRVHRLPSGLLCMLECRRR